MQPGKAKKIRGINIRKEEVKLFLFTLDMIICGTNSMEMYKNVSRMMNNLGKL